MPAGTWHYSLDCFIGGTVTVDYELLWRRGNDDTLVSEFTGSYAKGSDDQIPQHSVFDEPGIAIDYQPGDLLVFRYSTNAQSSPSAYTPNGDGSSAPGGSGTFPNLTLPP